MWYTANVLRQLVPQVHTIGPVLYVVQGCGVPLEESRRYMRTSLTEQHVLSLFKGSSKITNNHLPITNEP